MGSEDGAALTGPVNRLHYDHPEADIGRWSYGDLRVHSWGEPATLTIGAFCSLGPGVQIMLGGEHRPDWVTTFPFTVLWNQARHIPGHPRTKGDVTIGNDVWIGMETLILSGVSIGDGAVIGARSVVSDDVQPYEVVAGNPARHVRTRFDAQTVQRLLAVRWWDWDDDRIVNQLPLLLGGDAQAFLAAAERLQAPPTQTTT